MNHSSDLEEFSYFYEGCGVGKSFNANEYYQSNSNQASITSIVAAVSENNHSDCDEVRPTKRSQQLESTLHSHRGNIEFELDQELSPVFRTEIFSRSIRMNLDESGPRLHSLSRTPDRPAFCLNVNDSLINHGLFDGGHDFEESVRAVGEEQQKEEVDSLIQDYDHSQLSAVLRNIRKSKMTDPKQQWPCIKQIKEEPLSTDDGLHVPLLRFNSTVLNAVDEKAVKLKQLSTDVYKVVTSNRQGISFSQVVDEVVECYEQEEGKKFDFKNIKRRIYDCLNVMISSGCLKKTGKLIRPVDGATSSRVHSRIEQLAMRLEIRKRTEFHERSHNEKIEYYNKLNEKYLACQALRKRNHSVEGGTCEGSKILLPFIILEGTDFAVRSLLSQEVAGKMERESGGLALSMAKPFNIYCDVDAICVLNRQQTFSTRKRKQPKTKNAPPNPN